MTTRVTGAADVVTAVVVLSLGSPPEDSEAQRWVEVLVMAPRWGLWLLLYLISLLMASMRRVSR